MFDTATLLTYTTLAAMLVLAPGPGQALVLARTLEGGTRAGVVTAVGLEIGTLVHTLAAALGLSALLASSATAYSVIKYAGALYLVVLGALALLRAGRAAAPVAVTPGALSPPRRLLLHAAAVGTLNPKVAVFFLAFLPQFVAPERGAVLMQFVVLGALLAAMGAAWSVTLAALAGRARERVAASTRVKAWLERSCGAIMLGLGLKLAFDERR